MNGGFFDLGAPVFDAIDSVMVAVRLPSLLRVILFAAVFAVLGMWIYRRCSNQTRLAEVRTAVAATQRELATYEGDFAGLRGLIVRSTGLALRQVGLTFWPALLASVPLLFMLPWLSNRYAEQSPVAGETILACVEPAAAAAALAWQPAGSATRADEACANLLWPAVGESLELRDHAQAWLRLPLPAPTPVVHKRIALNALFGNPGGYLDVEAPFDAVRLDFAPLELVPFGPAWMRGWMFAFFVPLLVVSLIVKWRWKLH